MITLETFLDVVGSLICAAFLVFLVYAMCTHRSRMAAMADWTEKQRALGERPWKREIREENERSYRLQIENGWHRPDALELAKLQNALLTWSDEELDRLAALFRSSLAQDVPQRLQAEEVLE